MVKPFLRLSLLLGLILGCLGHENVSAQLPCEWGCASWCPMEYPYPVYVPGCDCPQYTDCVPVGTCDYCMYGGVAYCSGFWCWSYYPTAFNMGCCAPYPGT